MKLEILPIEFSDIEEVLAWNEGKDLNFLAQWAGNGYNYPLTYEQVFGKILKSRRRDGGCKVFKIILEEESVSRPIGTIELNEARMPRHSAMVCRYLLSEQHQGKGLGTLALMVLVKMAFFDMGYKMLRLKVFEYNKPAIRCYEKAGFRIVDRDIWVNGLEIYEMEIKKKSR
ncbi:MAG: GNAT family N-acetyltransferase [Clostridiales bacterium]|nr:GNAT family N-acetyltransferase [Clostridiales bacterium]